MISQISYAQESSLSIAESSLSRGDMKKLVSIFNSSIDVTFSNQVKTYTKSQAEIIIKKFFSKHDPKSFKIMNKGKSSTNNTIYAIGELKSNNGNFRVYMFFIPSKEGYLLRELRFEKN